MASEWAWLGRLVAERDNLRAALRWALGPARPALALRLNAALFSFWTTCSALPEARRWVEAALALPRPARGAGPRRGRGQSAERGRLRGGDNRRCVGRRLPI